MKKLSFLTLMVVFCLPLAALAQEREDPRVEIFGGYSLLHLNFGNINANANPTDNSSINLNGFDASITGNLTRHVGVVGEFGRYSTSQSISIPNLIDLNGSATLYTFLFGPRVVLHRGRLEPFAQGLFGAIRGSADATVAAGTTTTADQSGFAFAYALGGGVDLKVHRAIAIRLGQLDYLGVPTGSQTLNNFRYSAGIVFRLGNH